MKLRYFNTLLTLWKDSRGFTLVELLVALSIAGMLALAASGTLNQLLSLVPAGQNIMVAIRQVQDAGYWISNDGLQTQVVTPTPPPPPGTSSITLSPGTGTLQFEYIKWDITQSPPITTKTTVTYSIPNGTTTLQRLEVVTAEKTGVQISSKQNMIAQNITSVTVVSALINSKPRMTITVTAQLGTVTKTRTYQIQPRSVAL